MNPVLSRSGSIPNASIHSLRGSSSFKALGNSIISQNNLNSFTVSRIKDSLPQSPMFSPPHSARPTPALPDPPKTDVQLLRSPTVINNEKKHLRREIKPSYPPADLKFSVFAIYENGGGYDSRRRTYSMPKGMGLLLNEHLCLTSDQVLRDESDAINSFAQIKDGSIFRFDPYRAFVSIQNQFAICAFRASDSKVLESFRPIDVKHSFELEDGDQVFCFPFDTSREKKVLSVSETTFTFSSERIEAMLPGNPIFTVDWALQGLFISSDQHINTALRLQAVFTYLDSSIYILHNPLLEKFINQDKSGYIEKFHDRFLYYFEWGTTNIWRYNIDSKLWENVKIHNSEEFTKENELFTFGVNSRLVYLPSGSLVSIGGSSKTAGIELREVLEFSPQEFHTLKRLPDMLVPRTGAACAFCDGYIYACGGLPHPKTCEKYSVVSMKWLPISSMFYPRTNASVTAALGNDFLFVCGGEPVHPAGTTIERYSVKFNRWELLGLTLPRPLARVGLFPITNRRIALLGGSGLNTVFILNVNDVLSFDGVSFSNQVERDTYTLQDVFRALESPTETVFPVAFCRTNNTLYILNTHNSSPESLTFTVEEFSAEYFDISTRVDYSAKPSTLLAPVRTPYSLGRAWPNDSKLRLLK
jgi:hypothetical protein